MARRSHSLSLAHSVSQSLTLSLARSLTLLGVFDVRVAVRRLSHSLSLSRSHPHPLSLAHSLTLSLSHPLALAGGFGVRVAIRRGAACSQARARGCDAVHPKPSTQNPEP